MLAQTALLRARALLRLGRPQEAVTVVSGVFVVHGTLDASLTAQMLLGRMKKAGLVCHAPSEGSSLWELTATGRAEADK